MVGNLTHAIVSGCTKCLTGVKEAQDQVKDRVKDNYSKGMKIASPLQLRNGHTPFSMLKMTEFKGFLVLGLLWKRKIPVDMCSLCIYIFLN